MAVNMKGRRQDVRVREMADEWMGRVRIEK